MPVNSISGYILLSMPTNQIQPLSLLALESKGIVNTTGARIDNLFVDGEVPVPLVSEDYFVSSDISKTLTLDISVDSHLSLLEGLLNYLKLSASFKLQKNKSVKVQLLDARKNNVNEFNLDAFISSAKPNKTARAFAEMLDNDKLFVVTDILKCKKYSLEYADQKNIEAGLEANAATIGGAAANTKSGKEGTDKLVNEGEDYITIGLKAYRLHYSKDKKTNEVSYRIRKEDVIKTILDDEDFPGEPLQVETINIKM